MQYKIISTLKVILFLIPLSLAMAGETPAKSSKGATLPVVNINTASVEDLVTLPRIGPAIAKRIVEFRDVHKGFQKVEELMNVKGIGAKTFDNLKNRITVSHKES